LPLGQNKNVIFAFSQNFRENFCENFFTKIDASSGNIIDVEYLVNGALDLILFTKVGILK
jgi:hypothetical protein